MIPRLHQTTGAAFLAERAVALLADEPRVGKTGTAIMAADDILASSILVVTTKSGLAVWRRAFHDWSVLGRRVAIVTPATAALVEHADVVIVGWGSIAEPKLRAALCRRRWNVLIPDENHYAKNFETKRTQALYGLLQREGANLIQGAALAAHADRIWPLTGTPIPNTAVDIYPTLRGAAPDRLTTAHGPTDVTRLPDFLARYCIMKPKKIGRGCYARTLWVAVGGKNEAELAARLGGFILLRTQQDVGIGEPIYEIFPVVASAAALAEIEASVDQRRILAAAESGETKTLELELAKVRRLTGEMKVRPIAEAIREELTDGGLDKIVLMAWHHTVMEALREQLADFGVVSIDGATTGAQRATAEQAFQTDPNIRVFVGQIQAAGEAIDLSAAAELLFVEASFTPKDMKQASLRIANLTQKRQPRVRVAVLDGSIDDALQTILMRKWTSIRNTLSRGEAR